MSGSETDSLAYVITASTPGMLSTSDLSPALEVKKSKMDKNFKLIPIQFSFPTGELFFVPRAGLPADSARLDEIYSKHLKHITSRRRYTMPNIGKLDDIPSSWDMDLISGIAAEEFRSLLKLSCRFASEEEERLTVDDWMAILKLSKVWGMPDTRARAVKELDKEILLRTAGEKIILARRYDVEKWFKDGFREFVMRTGQISALERNELGWEIYARLLEERDGAWAKAAAHYQEKVTKAYSPCAAVLGPCQPCANCYEQFKGALQSSVQEELARDGPPSEEAFSSLWAVARK